MKSSNKKRNILIDKLINIKSLMLILIISFTLVRIPYLGFSNFNTDSFKWKQRIYDFGTGVFTLNFEKTNQKYHPGVTLLWIGTLAVKSHTIIYEYIYRTPLNDNSAELIFSLNFYQILMVVLVCSFLLGAFYRFLTKIYDPIKAFFICFIFSLEPFFLGLTTTLHLDGLLTLFIINSLITFYLFTKTNLKKYLIYSAIFFGLSLLTKTTALLFLPILLAVYLYVRNFQILTNFKNIFKELGLFIFVSVLIYIALWPAMWVAPVETIIYVFKGVVVGTDDHSQIYFGNLVSDPGPFYYLLVLFIKTPIYIFPTVLLALYRQLNTTYKKYTFESFILISSILYLIEITIPSKKLDRYILPISVLLSIYALNFIYNKFKERIIYLLLFNLFYILYLNFDYFSYYNPKIGGLNKNAFVVEPKWIFGQKELTIFFKNEIQKNNLELFPKNEADVNRVREDNNRLIVAMPEKYYTQLNAYLRYLDSFAVINELKSDAKRASYFIFPVWEDTSGEFKDRYSLEYYDTIKVRGEEVFLVYKKTKKND